MVKVPRAFATGRRGFSSLRESSPSLRKKTRLPENEPNSKTTPNASCALNPTPSGMAQVLLFDLSGHGN